MPWSSGAERSCLVRVRVWAGVRVGVRARVRIRLRLRLKLRVGRVRGRAQLPDRGRAALTLPTLTLGRVQKLVDGKE